MSRLSTRTGSWCNVTFPLDFDTNLWYWRSARSWLRGAGSRVTVFLNEAKATFHRPHPRPETGKGALRAVRRFLLQAGVRPEAKQNKSGAP